jgi:hypothetical protein
MVAVEQPLDGDRMETDGPLATGGILILGNVKPTRFLTHLLKSRLGWSSDLSTLVD